MTSKTTSAILGSAILLLIVLWIWAARQHGVDRSSVDLSAQRSDATPQPRSGAAGPHDGLEVIAVPRELQLPGIPTVRRAASYKDMLAHLSESDRKTVEALYRAYGAGWEGGGVRHHVLVFENEDQLAWLVQNGFPTPEELLAALKMPEHELLDLASSGNVKAGSLYLTRVALSPPSGENEVDGLRRASEEMQMESRLLGSGAAFSAYVIALRADRAGRPHEALAAYQLARLFGDGRATDFSMHYSSMNPGIPAVEALFAYSALQLRLGMANPLFRDSRNLTRRPRYPRWGTE